MNAHPGPFTSGFGSILTAENSQLQTVRTLLGRHDADSRHGVARLLEYHVAQLGAIIALLERRGHLLPHPERFEALSHLDSGRTARHPQPDGTPPLRALALNNQKLRQDIEALVGLSGHLDDGELALREASRRHAELDWMLDDLLNGTEVPGRPPGDDTLKAEAAWENEGGTSPSSDRT